MTEIKKMTGFALNKKLASECGKKSKRLPLNVAWRNILNSPLEEGISNMDKLLQTLLDKAFEGDVTAIREILDRTYGKVKKTNEYLGCLDPLEEERY